MSKFITGKDLENAVYDIIWEAKEKLLIVSPYIKLDDYFKEKLFAKHKNNPDLHIIIVFGKNEGNVKKSMNKQDFDYFKEFLNISIIHVPNLHGKYYGNEKKGVITSINLYDYSFINNIEFGVFSEQNLLNKISNGTDIDAWNQCLEIAETNEVVFIKRPVYQKKKMVVNLGRNYVKSDILLDSTDKFYGFSRRNKQKLSGKKLNDFQEFIDLGQSEGRRPDRYENDSCVGFCIRTGESIPFNLKKPYSDKAYTSWARYKNPNYPEKFCHKTGKRSHGRTSMNKPIMN